MAPSKVKIKAKTGVKAGAKTRAKAKTKAAAKTKSSRAKVQAYRARMRAQGMKLIQIWVPDVNSPHFAAEARRQSALAAASPHAKEDQDFIDSISIWPGDDK